MKRNNLPSKPPHKNTGPIARFRSFGFLRQLILLALLCVFFGSGFLLLQSLVLEPHRVQEENNAIRRLYYGQSTAPNQIQPDTTPTEVAEAPTTTWEELRAINSDIVGWIRVPGTVIDYPVLQSSSDTPEYYLRHNYQKQYSSHGSIFLSTGSDLVSSRNLLLYGHSMKDGQMFAALLDFNESKYRQTPVLQFDTAGNPGKWKIIAILKTNTLSQHGEVFPFHRTTFQDDTDYMNHIYQLRIRSIVNTPVDVLPSDRIVTLSTCSYEFEEFRTVIVARKVRDGETDTVAVETATPNTKVVYPDCWYEKYGGEKPSWPATFQEAREQNRIPWPTENTN